MHSMDQSHSVVNTLLIGFGHHTRRIYHPLYELSHDDPDLNLCVAVDLSTERGRIESFLVDKRARPAMIYLDQYEGATDDLSADIEQELDAAVARHAINCVIIATEPLAHLAYAKWALRRGLSVLMDKPISSYENVSTSLEKARKVADDYYVLNSIYQSCRVGNPRQVFSMMAQRRFQTSFGLIKERIRSCFEQTNCPVTNVQTFHSDGQWRMPTEIVEQYYHGYNQGYGKCSHSGYHYFDIIPYVIESGLGDEKCYDNVEVFSHAVRPLDVINQVTISDYERLFGEKLFNEKNKYSEAELTRIMRNFGEVDCTSSICFKRGDSVITSASINLTHNGYSQRNWVTAQGRDLYKGNGRISHESHIIQQGPFQAIHFHSYKSDEATSADGDGRVVGTSRHLEIYVFRNHKMLGGQHVEVFNVDDLIEIEGGNRGIVGKSKAKVFYEFMAGVRGQIRAEDMRSDFSRHEAGAVLASAVYQSLCKQMTSENPLIKMPLRMDGESVSRKAKVACAAA